MARNADWNQEPVLVLKALICPRTVPLFWSLNSKCIAEIEREHQDAVVLVFARQDGLIIDSCVAQIDIFEGPADVHAFVPLVLSADGITESGDNGHRR